MENQLNKYSRLITQDESLPAAQAMLYAIGMNEDDQKKAQVGIVSTGFQGNPCNMHLNDIATMVKKEVDRQKDLYGLIFHTIGVSDGITNGTEGMKYSLPSRELIADSIETVVSAQFYDAVIPIVGCDKNMPGAMIALGRLNRPAILMYGGTVKKGSWKDKDLNIVSAFEAYGEKLRGKISDFDYKGIIRHSIPGAGACGGMYTANSMAAAIECMGMSLPYTSSNPAVSPQKRDEAQTMASAIKAVLENDIKPRDIMTRKAFENAITLIMAMGGSTNAVIHLIAMAKSVNIPLSIDDFQEISNRTPYLADLKPSGRYLMEDLHNIGGIPAVMKFLLKEGLIDGNPITVTGKTIGENLESVPDLPGDQKIIAPVSHPIKESGHIQILYGNLATEGAVAKITGKEGTHFSGPAHVFEDEKEAIEGIGKSVKPGEVIVIRNSGPKGAPGMPEMLKPTGAVMGAGLGNDVALITDGRFSGGSHGFVVGHITPEAYNGGLIGLIQDGDIITIDINKNLLEVDLAEEEIEKRKKGWKPTEKPATGILKKFRNSVASASQGCVTDQ
ncbi:dihydroxy-acid dehydratase [Marinilabilia salmonicolor]|jgi:dihydroxy-acid dehydratase|uniref:Dihydroxy-acid dehydratase n=1 Tax=Marinilabilia salmonicolor TaxID=989 RepID=A0A368V957_9BACT|nr:dihydroxy-acid dehydratase [Marinilabilia salmonicolor]RCW36194.1 dihydroxy-acid dehydratase [Marinilabilia salmonicolor]